MNDTSNLKLVDPGLLKTRAFINGKWCDADDGAAFSAAFGLVSVIDFASGFGVGFSTGNGPVVLSFDSNAASGASRWCLTDASTASLARPGDTGFIRNR